jgi:SAM-dependent methyltransferase
MAVLEQSMAVLRSSLQTKIMSLESRLDQRGRPTATGMSAAGLEFLLAHSRLPAPPSRILDLAGILAHGGIDLGSLGYHIENHSAGADDWAAVVSRLGDSPARPATEQALRELLRLVQPGGRLILSMPLAVDQPFPAWLERFGPRDTARAHRDGQRWTFKARSAPRSAEPSLLLSVVEKP